MDLSQHYNSLYEDSVQKIKLNQYETDNLIASPLDTRKGITLLFRPDVKVIQNIHRFLNELKIVEPEQYYYPASDIHVTVLSIISCYAGFDLAQIKPEEYVALIERCLPKHPIEIEFRGVTASPNCIMIQGFMMNNTLTQLRENLRKAFKNSTLQQSIDMRYTIETAHSTVVRLRKKLIDKELFIQALDKYRSHTFGHNTINKVELVYNDWYQRKEKVKILAEFKLT